jgi:hypothetical protein
MRYFLITSLLFLAGCGNIELPRIDPGAGKVDTIKSEVESLTKERDDAKAKQSELIKTSKQALDAAAAAERRAQAADEVAREARAQAKGFRDDADRLRNQEIADKIRFWSWLTAITGAAVTIFGVLLMVFGGSPAGAAVMAVTGGRTAKVAITFGVCILGLGLFGLWAAPHWIWGAWIAGACIAATIAGVVLKVLRDKILESAQGHTAVKLAADYGDKMEALVRQAKQMLEPAAADRLEQAVKESKLAASVDQARNKVHGLIDRIRKPVIKK